jgi:hypothetical protein
MPNGSIIDHFGAALIGIFLMVKMVFRGNVHNHLYQTSLETKHFLEWICNIGWRVSATILENVFKLAKTETSIDVTSCLA